MKETDFSKLIENVSGCCHYSLVYVGTFFFLHWLANIQNNSAVY